MDQNQIKNVLADRNCDNCAWDMTAGDDSICMRALINIPVKGQTAVIDGEACKWNKCGTVGTAFWGDKAVKSPMYVFMTAIQRENEVGPIELLHL